MSKKLTQKQIWKGIDKDKEQLEELQIFCDSFSDALLKHFYRNK